MHTTMAHDQPIPATQTPPSGGQAIARDRPHVVILGSGKSILTLSDKDREFIEQCDARIAINKFGAFSDIAGIEPTHIFFLESYEQSCWNILQHIFAQTIKARRAGVTFVVSTDLRDKCVPCDDSRRSLLDAAGYFSQLEHDPFFWRTLPELKGDPEAFLIPVDCHLQFRAHHDWLSGGPWATNSTETLFHFRGSLTSAINYATVEFPNAVIWLVGTDFTDGGYFFDDALDRITYPWQDWTTAETRESGVHASIRPLYNISMLDAFPVICEEVDRSGSTIHCANPQSLFVRRGLVSHHALTHARPPARQLDAIDENHRSDLCLCLSRRVLTLAETLQHTRLELQRSLADVQRSQAELHAVLKSPAWRVTAPLRLLRSLFTQAWDKSCARRSTKE